MAVKDYAHILDRVQRGLGRAFGADPSILNIPGRSAAVKIDAHYYLAAWPGALKALSRMSGYPPGTLKDALQRSGNLITGRDSAVSMQILVNWRRPPRFQSLNSAFFLAIFIEGALKIYGGKPEPLPLSGLRLHRDDRETVMQFFTGKTPPSETAFF